MKIAIIGSTQYLDRMKEHRSILLFQYPCYWVRLPVLDQHPELDELGILTVNREMIEWADEVHVLWDQRSMGTMFDFGMAFALRKHIKIVFLEPKTFTNALKQYEAYGGKMEPLFNRLLRIINSWNDTHVIDKKTKELRKLADLPDSEKARYIISWLSGYLEVKNDERTI